MDGTFSAGDPVFTSGRGITNAPCSLLTFNLQDLISYLCCALTDFTTNPNFSFRYGVFNLLIWILEDRLPFS